MKKIPLLWLVEHAQAERAAARLRAKEIQYELLQKEQDTPDGKKKMLYSVFVDENVFNEAQAAVNAKTKFEYKPPKGYGMKPLTSIVDASGQKHNRYFSIILICLVVFLLACLVYMLVLFT